MLEMREPLDITGPLIDLRSNRQGPVDQIYPVVYDELRRRAHWLLARERPDHTLSTTALVHEAYVRLADQTQLTWEDRAHFCAIAARAMRQILVDFARKRNAEKRGGGVERLRLDENELAVTMQSTMVLDLDEALTRLGQIDERMAGVVESRFLMTWIDEPRWEKWFTWGRYSTPARAQQAYETLVKNHQHHPWAEFRIKE